MDGRGFVLIRGLPRERWSNDEMCLAYWGIGAHLGRPWPQNPRATCWATSPTRARRRATRPRAATRSGRIGLDFHCDGSDLVGLLCLQTGDLRRALGGRNSVALHNDLVRERPGPGRRALQAAALRLCAANRRPGKRGWYLMPVFTSMAAASSCA